jgi:hypothetical protein
MNGMSWSLKGVNTDNGTETLVTQGTFSCGQSQTVYINATLPANGLYVLRPGTWFWSAATVSINPPRPNTLLASAAYTFTQWWGLPNAFFYVPKGTTSFNLTVAQCGGGMSAPTVEYHPATIEGEYNPLTFPGSRKIIEPGFKTEWETTEPVLGKVIR